MALEKLEGYWTHDRIGGDGGHLYYFAPANHDAPPYRRQIIVEAIIDIANDGTLAGVELIDHRMPPPPVTKSESKYEDKAPRLMMWERLLCREMLALYAASAVVSGAVFAALLPFMNFH